MTSDPHTAAEASSDRPATRGLLLTVGPAALAALGDARRLARVGLRCVALTGLGGLEEAARNVRFDALVLDAAVLADGDGALLSRLRARLGCPVLVLAEGGDEVDEIIALELGADAWLAAPPAPRRLHAHLAALLRRPRMASGARRGSGPPSAAGWQLDRGTNRLRRGGRTIELTETQAALLQCLIDASGRVVPRGQLLATLPLSRAAHERDIDVYLHRLRKRLRDEGAPDLAIEGIRNRGYLLHTEA